MALGRCSRGIVFQAMADFVAAIDQGTTSTRCMIFDHSGREVGKYQLEHKQIMPSAGWVEHDPLEIWQRTQEVVQHALAKRSLGAADLVGLGITNQRETTVVWDPVTGAPYGNAIVWQDTRTDKIAAALDPRRPGRCHPASGGPAAGHLLLRRQVAMDFGERRRRA